MAVLDRLLKELEEITSRLDEFIEKGYNLNDWRDQMAALHALQVQAQIVLDIVQRLLSNMGVTAEGYKDAVRKLKERGLIDGSEERFLSAVVGFRNVIVHEYSEVDLSTVEEILKKREYRRLLTLVMELRKRAEKYWDP